MKASIDNLKAAGMATVAATGNKKYRGFIEHPACISSAVSVGATDDSDKVAAFSNSASFLTFFAPGVDITSSVPGDQYISYEGTSMATPHVAGAWPT